MTQVVLFCAALLGAASAMSFGGANVTPGYLAIGFLAISVFIRPQQLIYTPSLLVRGRPGIFLAAIVVWAFASGFLLPRLFAGEVMVFPLNFNTRLAVQAPLYPAGSNFNQAVYSLAGPLVFLIVASLARTPLMLRRATIALIISSAVNLLLATLDLATFLTGTEAILDFVRNADYAQLQHHRIMGIKRLTGHFQRHPLSLGSQPCSLLSI